MYSRDSVDGGRIMNGGQLVAARVNQADAGSALIDPRSRVLPLIVYTTRYRVKAFLPVLLPVRTYSIGRALATCSTRVANTGMHQLTL